MHVLRSLDRLWKLTAPQSKVAFQIEESLQVEQIIFLSEPTLQTALRKWFYDTISGNSLLNADQYIRSSP